MQNAALPRKLYWRHKNNDQRRCETGLGTSRSAATRSYSTWSTIPERANFKARRKSYDRLVAVIRQTRRCCRSIPNRPDGFNARQLADHFGVEPAGGGLPIDRRPALFVPLSGIIGADRPNWKERPRSTIDAIPRLTPFCANLSGRKSEAQLLPLSRTRPPAERAGREHGDGFDQELGAPYRQEFPETLSRSMATR
jgi:hypothetical protein